MKIKITWLSDEYECDTCGTTYSEGAIIETEDAKLVLQPVAHCFGGRSWDRDEVYKEAFGMLGYELEEIYGS